jgi:hypothetical protein
MTCSLPNLWSDAAARTILETEAGVRRTSGVNSPMTCWVRRFTAMAVAVTPFATKSCNPENACPDCASFFHPADATRVSMDKAEFMAIVGAGEVMEITFHN